MTRSSLRALLRRVARLLETEAKISREGCRSQFDKSLWSCTGCAGAPSRCPAKKSHDKKMMSAKELRCAAEKGIRGG